MLNELKPTDSTRDAVKTQTTCCHCLWQQTELSTLSLIITFKQRLKHLEHLNTSFLENWGCYHVRLQQSSVTSSHTLIKVLFLIVGIRNAPPAPTGCWRNQQSVIISESKWRLELHETRCCLLSSLICDLRRSTCSHPPSFHLLKKVSTSEQLARRPHRNIRCLNNEC